MQAFDLEHTFDVPPAALWEAVWDPRLLGWMCARLSTLERRDVLAEEVRPDGRTRRVVRSVPRDRVPAVARKVLSVDMLSWEEEQIFFRKFRDDEPRLSFTITPSSGLRTIFGCKGGYEVRPIDGGKRSLRRIHGEVEVRVGPLVTRVAEGYLLKEITRGLDEEATHLIAFLAAHPPAPPATPPT